MTKNKRIAQILLPVFILVAVGIIWFMKSQAPPMEHAGERPLTVTSLDFTEMQSHGLPIFLAFGTESCGPCRQMAPDLSAVHHEMLGKAIIQYLDVQAYPEAVRDYPIQVTPTQIFFNTDGTPYSPSETIANSIPNFQLYSTRDTGEHSLTLHQGALTAAQMRAILVDMGVAA